MSNRLKDLAVRLVQSGPKAAYVSCSETQEISDGVFELLEENAKLQQANDENQSLIGLLEAEVEKCEQERDKYLSMVVYTGAIMDQSDGIAGYHLNGDIAGWNELFTDDSYKDALDQNNLEQQVKGIEDAVKATASDKYRLPLRDACELLDYANQLRQQARELNK